ncbi:hypothetical protein [Chryseobacterium lactis]|uniref:hypothetical protein n=1 Tax=Chryseobacterium lactis TaxID=1241981 RepID=UPI0016260B0D|nr:hypothetical protein [Chryseobacterium lactis]
MKTKITEIIQRIKNKHVNDPTVSEDKDQITEMILHNVEESIPAINSLDENSLEWISSRFEEISYQLQNKKFIECLQDILIRFSKNVTLKNDVQDAVEAYYGNE